MGWLHFLCEGVYGHQKNFMERRVDSLACYFFRVAGSFSCLLPLAELPRFPTHLQVGRKMSAGHHPSRTVSRPSCTKSHCTRCKTLTQCALQAQLGSAAAAACWRLVALASVGCHSSHIRPKVNIEAISRSKVKPDSHPILPDRCAVLKKLHQYVVRWNWGCRRWHAPR